MHNIWLIAKREYMERVTTKSFIVMTVLIPLLMGGFTFGAGYMNSKAKSNAKLAIVSRDTQLALDLQHELQSAKHSSLQVDVMAPTLETQNFLQGEIKDKALDGYLWITPAATPAGRPTFTYTTRTAAEVFIQGDMKQALRTVLVREKLAHEGMVASDVDALMQPVKVEVKEFGSENKSSVLVAYFFFFLMYMVVLMYGMNVARSIIEEKTSRVFEVMLSTIRPEEMLAGKIIGVGSVGLTQVAVWLIAGALLAASPVAVSLAGGEFAFSISPVQAGFFVLYFIFGTILYSSAAAALGAMTNSEQELQQYNMFLMMPLFFCLLMLGPIVANPSSTLARVVSLIPFCSPLLMNFRISLAMPAVWEIALSFLLMSLTIGGVLWIASRIYRVGILMYGKKPNLPEILRWLKYS